jgi:hypothetical protein
MSLLISRNIFLFGLFVDVSMSTLQAAKLSEIMVVDQNHVRLRFLDGEVTHRDDGIGPNAFTNNYHEDNIDTVKLYNPALGASSARLTSSWTLKSADDTDTWKL